MTGIGDYVEGPAKIYAQRLYEASLTQKHHLGMVRPVSDNRTFVYTKAGSVDLAAGKMCQAAAPVADHLNQLVKANAAVGDKEVVMAIGATALTANQYHEGWLHVNDATGEGFVYKIRGHKAYAASATDVKILLYDGIRKALVADVSEVTLTRNRYDSVILMPTAPSSSPVGVPPIDVPAGRYFWLQLAGASVCLADGTLIVGTPCVTSDIVSGAVEDFVPGTSLDTVVGRVLQVNANTEYALIDLRM